MNNQKLVDLLLSESLESAACLNVNSWYWKIITCTTEPIPQNKCAGISYGHWDIIISDWKSVFLQNLAAMVSLQQKICKQITDACKCEMAFLNDNVNLEFV